MERFDFSISTLLIEKSRIENRKIIYAKDGESWVNYREKLINDIDDTIQVLEKIRNENKSNK